MSDSNLARIDLLELMSVVFGIGFVVCWIVSKFTRR